MAKAPTRPTKAASASKPAAKPGKPAAKPSKPAVKASKAATSTASATSKAAPAAAGAAKATAASAPARPKKATNPGGLAARPLKKVCEYLDEGRFDPANEIYEVEASPDAPPLAALVLWYALQPDSKPTLAWFAHLPDDAPPASRIAVLARLIFAKHEAAELGYSATPAKLVRVLHPLVQAEPAAVHAAIAARTDWPPWVAPAVAMACWLAGQAITPAQARAVAALVARDQVHDEFRQVTPPGRDDEPSARELGVALVGADAWAELLRVADRGGKHRLASMPEAFASGPWPDLVASLQLCDHRPTRADEAAFVALVAARGDDEASLLALADELRAAHHTSTFADLADLVVVERRLDRAQPVLDVAARLRFVSQLPFALAATRRLLSAVPEADRLALMAADRERFGEGLTVVALADHFDDALLDAYLARESLAGEVLGQLGAPVLAAVEARWAAARNPTVKIKLEIALFSAIAAAAIHGHPLTDAHVQFLADYPASHPQYAEVVRALPEPARATLWRAAARRNEKPRELVELLGTDPPDDDVLAEIVPLLRERHPGGPWSYMPARVAACYAPASEAAKVSPAVALARACEAAGGAKERIYAFELDGAEPPDGSLTRLGASPKRGDKTRHLLTLDLRDAPELGARFPGARALVLRVPRVNSGARSAYDATSLAALDASAATALPVDDDAEPLRVVPIMVPTAAFTDRASPVRKLLTALPGYALGRPLSIQGRVPADAFVLQLDDTFDLDLGDGGRLYVGDGWATWDSA